MDAVLGGKIRKMQPRIRGLHGVRWEGNTKMNLKAIEWNFVSNSFIWFRIESSGFFL